MSRKNMVKKVLKKYKNFCKVTTYVILLYFFFTSLFLTYFNVMALHLR